MDSIIAVEVTLQSGKAHHYLTWGRIQDAVDTGPVAAIVLQLAQSRSDVDRAVSARVCETLQEARDAPYFFECYFDMCREPEAEDWEAWRAEVDRAMQEGSEIYFLGKPQR